MASDREKGSQGNITARWPITIITKRGKIEGESRNITVTGVFINCNEDLQEDETCRMVIKPPRKKSIEVKGKLVWSNGDSNNRRGSLPGMGFSFIKVNEEDLHLLNQAILSGFESTRKNSQVKAGAEIPAGGGEKPKNTVPSEELSSKVKN